MWTDRRTKGDGLKSALTAEKEQTLLLLLLHVPLQGTKSTQHSSETVGLLSGATQREGG